MSIVTGKKVKSRKVVGVHILNVYDLSSLPDPADFIHGIVVCSNGAGAGAASLAYSDGTHWKAIAIGAVLAAS